MSSTKNIRKLTCIKQNPRVQMPELEKKPMVPCLATTVTDSHASTQTKYLIPACRVARDNHSIIPSMQWLFYECLLETRYRTGTFCYFVDIMSKKNSLASSKMYLSRVYFRIWMGGGGGTNAKY